MRFARLPNFKFGILIFGAGTASISPACQVLNSAIFNSAERGGGAGAHARPVWVPPVSPRLGEDPGWGGAYT